ncbi:MAG: hypothetical protein LBH25_04570 [Fibromonadaceae bacterium]|jgi:peptidoglycan hydrolase CwlO-like protein|nr:hypothetical protein [Fibromonadaceae bacterium]
MNQETIKLVTAKIEKTLELARVLKSEKADLEAIANGLRDNLKEKDKIIEELSNSKEQLLAEVRSLQEALNERDNKLNESEEAIMLALEKVNEVLAKEADIESKSLEAESNRGFF